MRARLFDFKGEPTDVEIPDDTDRIIGVVVSGDMIILSPFYKDTSDTRNTDYFDGGFSIPIEDIDRLNSIDKGRDSSYEVLSIWGIKQTKD